MSWYYAYFIKENEPARHPKDWVLAKTEKLVNKDEPLLVAFAPAVNSRKNRIDCDKKSDS
jgi:hypothetical protein